MAQPEKVAPAGRAAAPGQQKERTFVNDATGVETTGTMEEFHTTLKDQGYRPKDDTEEATTTPTPV